MPDKIEFEQVTCNLCGSPDFETYLEREDLYTLLPGKFRLVRCRQCGLVYQNPRPAPPSFELIYPAEYGPYTPGLKEENALRRLDRRYGLRKRVNLVLKYQKTGTLCDIGCATGDFIEELGKRPGWKATGIEPNAQASAYARSLGLDVRTGSIDEIDFPPASFDVISMWHVVEHLYDPAATFEKLRRWLKPGGIFILTTPNLDCLDARLFGPYWAGFELPRHFYVFSLDTLQQLLSARGYRLLATRFFYGSHSLFMSSVRFWLRARHGRSHPRLEAALFSLPSRVLLMPLFFILDRLKLTSPMTAIARKEGR